MDDIRDGPLVGHLAFDAFGHELHRIPDFRLEITIRRAACHRTQRAHAAIGLVGAALIEKHLAGAFIRARQQRADHGAGGARRERLGEIAGILDAAIGDHRHVFLRSRLGRFQDRRELRDAHARDDARRADRTRADADLHGIRTGIDQRPGAGGRRHVAGDDLNGIGEFLDARDRIQNLLGMAMRGIDHHAIDTRVDQEFRAPIAFLAGGRGGGDPQAALAVLVGVGVEARLFDILHGEQAHAAIIAIDNEQLLDAMAVEELARLGLRHILAHGHEVLVAGHQLTDGLVHVLGEANVAMGENAHELAGFGTAIRAAIGHHRQAVDALGLHDRQCLAERGIRRDRHRVHDDAALETLHLPHIVGLFFRRKVAMDDAEAAGLGHGDGEAGFRHRVHGRRDDRQIEADGAREPRAQIGFRRQHLGMAGAHEHVVEGECFGNSGGKRFRHANTPVLDGRKPHLAMRCGSRMTTRADPARPMLARIPTPKPGERGSASCEKSSKFAPRIAAAARGADCNPASAFPHR